MSGIKFTDFKGAAKRLDDVDLPRIGHKIGVGEDELHAFMDTEALGGGFDSQGRPKALYEPHVAYRVSSGAVRQKLVAAGLAYPKWKRNYPKDSYPRIKKAYAISPRVALLASSWGYTQILGESYKLAGYDSVEQMVADFMEDEEHHIEAMVAYIVSTHIDDDLRRLAELKRPTTPADCVPIVRVYNGAQYEKNKYHIIFARNHNKWRKIKDTPYKPDVSVAPEDDDRLMYSGAKHPRVEAVQTALRELGWPEVGNADGRWGTKTETAVLGYRKERGLDVEAKIDAELDEDIAAALEAGWRRPISQERATASLHDLRKKGAEDAKAARDANLTGKILTGGGAALGVPELIDAAKEHSDTAKSVVDNLKPLFGFYDYVRPILIDNFWLLLVIGGGFIVYKSGVIERIRLQKHRTGEDVSL